MLDVKNQPGTIELYYINRRNLVGLSPLNFYFSPNILKYFFLILFNNDQTTILKRSYKIIIQIVGFTFF